METMGISFLRLGFFELMLLLSPGGLFGLPPGERDPAFLRCAPEKALVYCEWAERADGTPGAAGIDGLAADPEIAIFMDDVQRAVRTAVRQRTENGAPEEQILGRYVPDLVLRVLNRSGCFFISYDQQAVANAPPEAGATAALLGLQAALIVNGGDEADEIARHVEGLLKLLPADDRVEGLQRQALPAPLPGMKLTLHRHEDYFIVGLGEGTLDSVLAGLAEERTGLGGNPRFLEAYDNIAFDRTASVNWIDVRGIIETTIRAIGPVASVARPVIAMLGVDAVDSYVGSIGVVDGQVYSRSFLTTGGSADGLLVLAAGPALEPSHLTLIPADADLVGAVSLDVPKILKTVQDTVRNVDPNAAEALQSGLGQLEQELSFSLEDDVYPAFGPAWTVHDSPAAGGLFITSLVGSLEVRDPQKAEAVFTKLMAILKDALPGDRSDGNRRRGVFLAHREFLGRTIYYVNTVGNDDVIFAPAFCITDKQLLVAPHPQALKAHLRFLKQGGTGFGTRMTEFGIPEGDPIALFYFETRSLVETLYAFAPYAAQVAFTNIQAEGGEIDVFSLPSARAVVPYMKNTVVTVVRTKNGLLCESRNGVPFLTGSGAAPLIPLFFMGAVRTIHRHELR